MSSSAARSTRSGKKQAASSAPPAEIHSEDSSRKGESRGKRKRVVADDSSSDEGGVDVRTFIDRVKRYPLFHGRVYPDAWVSSKIGMSFLSDLLKIQGWKTIVELECDVYPSEVIQFYATVVSENEKLVAMVNHKKIKISLKDLCGLLVIPNEGVDVTGGTDWMGMEPDEILETKRSFDSNATYNGRVLTSGLSAHQKFLFNMVCSTFVPRRTGRDHLLVHEMILISKMLKGDKVNLGKLVLSHIAKMAVILREDKLVNGGVVPYAMWISKLIQAKGALFDDSKAIRSPSVMDDKVLGQMGMVLNNGVLMFKGQSLAPSAKGQTYAAATTDMPPHAYSTAQFSVHPDLSMWLARLEEKLDTQIAHSEKMEVLLTEQVSRNEQLMAQLTAQTTVHNQLLAAMGEITKHNEKLVGEWELQRRRFGKLDKDLEDIKCGGVWIGENQNLVEKSVCLQKVKVDTNTRRVEELQSIVQRIKEATDTLLYRSRP